MDIYVGFSLFSLRFGILWFFNVSYHFQDVNLPCVFFPFMPFSNDLFEVLAIHGSKEMMEGEEVLDRGNLRPLTNDSIRIHLT